MKILHCIYDNPSNPWLGGGGAEGTFASARFMESKGHQTTILCAGFKGAPGKTSESFGEIIHAGIGVSYLLSRLSYSVFSFFYIVRKYRNYDLIVDDTSPFSPTFSFVFSKRIPVIANIRNIFGLHIVKKKPVAGIAAILFEYLILHCYCTYIVVSPYMKEYIPRKKKCEILPNGINFEEIPDLSNDTKELYIAFLGRIEIYQKGLDILVQAIFSLENLLREKGVTVEFAGSGNDEQAFKQLIAQNKLEEICHCIGRIEGDEKYHFLARAMFCVCPSRYEAMPRVPLEAQACGTPVIASDIPSFRFVVKNHESGILVEPENIPRLEESLKDLVLNDEKKILFGKNAVNFSRKFQRNIFLNDRMQMYKNTIKAFR
ncbi:MAG: glycosyltransferase [Chitinivibrionales bacterium]|nr:glycosyltransferase [Chitinivibrionales bacterium]